MNEFMPEKLAEIIEDFQMCDGREKLEYLLDLSERLPDLPPELEGKQDGMAEVHECLTPVFVHGELVAGKMHYWFAVPPDAPTARGYASMLMEGVNDQGTPAEILRIPDLFYLDTGLQTVLTGQRMHGVSAFLRYMKQIASETVTE